MKLAQLSFLTLGITLAFVFVSRVVWSSQSEPAIPAAAVIAVVGDRRVALHVGPLIDGQRIIDVWTTDQRGRPLDSIKQVSLSFAMPFICADVIDLTLDPVAPGHFHRQGAFFGMAGSWVTDLTLHTATGDTSQTRLVAVIDQPDVNNPFGDGRPPEAAFLNQGRQLYVTHCAACHGMQGRGDGPRSVALTPRPTDLTTHMVAGKHTDEQTYLTISNGRSNTAMPAWGGTLSELELWQLTAYIRTFAQPNATAPVDQPANASQP
jgi:mono/diheme cytochrome c family protein